MFFYFGFKNKTHIFVFRSKLSTVLWRTSSDSAVVFKLVIFNSAISFPIVQSMSMTRVICRDASYNIVRLLWDAKQRGKLSPHLSSFVRTIKICHSKLWQTKLIDLIVKCNSVLSYNIVTRTWFNNNIFSHSVHAFYRHFFLSKIISL